MSSIKGHGADVLLIDDVRFNRIYVDEEKVKQYWLIEADRFDQVGVRMCQERYPLPNLFQDGAGI